MMRVHVRTLALRERGRLRQAGPALQESLMSPRAANRAPPHTNRGSRTAPTPPGVTPPTPPTAAEAASASSGGSIFWLLPAFNLAVLALELVYQVCMWGGVRECAGGGPIGTKAVSSAMLCIKKGVSQTNIYPCDQVPSLSPHTSTPPPYPGPYPTAAAG